LEVCQRVKESRDIARTPVLLTVGKLEPFKKEDARRVRAEAVVVKPFEASELMAAVNKIAEYFIGKAPEARKGSLRDKPERAKPVRAKQDVPEEVDSEAAEQAVPVREASAADPGHKEAVRELTPSPAAHGHNAPESVISHPEEAADLPSTGSSTAGDSETAQPFERANSDEGPAEGNEPLRSAAVIDEALEQPDQVVIAPVARAAAAAAEGQTLSAQPVMTGAAHENTWPNAPGIPEFDVRASEQPHVEAAPAIIPTSFASTAPAPADADPAFIEDRNQAMTAFPTHFGVRQEVEGSGVSPAPADDVESALANLPGNEAPGSAASGFANNAWVADEVPVEATEEGVLLEEEMNHAEASMAADANDDGPATGHTGGEREHPYACSAADGAGERSELSAPTGDTNLAGTSSEDVSQPGDHHAGANGSAEAPPEIPGVDLATLENIVGRILEQLKPQIVAEIAREIAAGKK
jgi:hypothetical protein